MDISFIIVLWVIISIVQAINDRKKAPPPPQIPPDFEIPTLANDPNQAEIEEVDVAEIYRQKKKSETPKVQTESEIVEEKNIALDLTPSAAMHAMILNEVLDKPKSLRRKKF